MVADLATDDLNTRVVREIRKEMAGQRVSQARIAEILGRNQTYVSYRLTGKKSLTLADIEEFAHALHVEAERWLQAPDPFAPRRRRASLCQVI